MWARLRFFRIKSKTAAKGSLLYDPLVAIQIVITYFCLFEGNQINLGRGLLGIALYGLGLSLFWWAIATAKHLNYALSNQVGKIVTNGPFAWIRHPIYISYSIIWISSTLLFNSVSLWITLSLLMAFYITSAKMEEKVILKSEYSREYREYSQNVGMFLPRIRKWIK